MGHLRMPEQSVVWSAFRGVWNEMEAALDYVVLVAVSNTVAVEEYIQA